MYKQVVLVDRCVTETSLYKVRPWCTMAAFMYASFPRKEDASAYEPLPVIGEGGVAFFVKGRYRIITTSMEGEIVCLSDKKAEKSFGVSISSKSSYMINSIEAWKKEKLRAAEKSSIHWKSYIRSV